MNRPLIALAASLLPLLAAAQAATPVIWRCGAGGRSYSDQPCADGRPQGTVEVAVARPQADVDEARVRARREQREADQLRAQRLAVEEADAAALRKAQAAAHKAAKAIKPVAAQPPQRQGRRLQSRRPLADDGIFRAVAPASRPTRG